MLAGIKLMCLAQMNVFFERHFLDGEEFQWCCSHVLITAVN